MSGATKATKGAALDPAKVYEAIAQGVESAILRIVYSGTDLPTLDFFECIERGVARGMERVATEEVSADRARLVREGKVPASPFWLWTP